MIGTDTGFEGPNVEEIEETLAAENEKKTKRYVSNVNISVIEFLTLAATTLCYLSSLHLSQ